MFVNGDLKGKFIMDRNLGARDTKFAEDTKGLLHYPFGRKDPLPGGLSGLLTTAYIGRGGEEDQWRIETMPGPTKIYIAVNNPMLHVAASTNWCSDADSEVYVWNDYETDISTQGKSILDPSPKGWKVPPHGTWSSFSTETTSWNDGSVDGQYGSNYQLSDERFAYYPAHASRSPSTGTMGALKTVCYKWSSTPGSKIGSYYAGFHNNGNIFVNSVASNRNSPHTLRCVQHDE